MSTQNFVSYGDAETLMSGVKDAIDGATEGNATIRKHIIAEITDRTLTMDSALAQIRAAINSYLSGIVQKEPRTEIMRNTYIFIRNYGTEQGPICYGIYRYMYGAWDWPVYGLVDRGLTANSNYVSSIRINSTTSGNTFALNGVNHASDTLTALNILKIQLIHQELVEGSNALISQVAEIESDVSGLDTRVTALEQGGGGLTINYFTQQLDTSHTYAASLYSLYDKAKEVLNKNAGRNFLQLRLNMNRTSSYAYNYILTPYYVSQISNNTYQYMLETNERATASSATPSKQINIGPDAIYCNFLNSGTNLSNTTPSETGFIELLCITY